MSIEIKVPDIGADEVEITEILVKVGESVTAEQTLMTVEGDKASMEIPAPIAGVIKAINVALGDKVTTDSLIMLFEAPFETTTASETTIASETTTAASTTPIGSSAPLEEAENLSKEIKVPDIGADEVEVTEILVKVGESITAEQTLITVEGDKASMEVPAPHAGVITAINIAVGDKVKTGSVIMACAPLVATAPPAQIEKKAAADLQSNSAATLSSVPVPASAPITATRDDAFVRNPAYVHASPVVRRLAREYGIDLTKVVGTGRRGRIVQDDIHSYVKPALAQTSNSPATGAGLPGMLPWPKVDFSKFGEVETVELSRIQKISGQNLSRNWMIIPHVTQFDECDITDIEAFRQQQNAIQAKGKNPVKITPLVFIMKAVAYALEAFPRFNSALSADAQQLTLKKYINIGVAVDTPNGLVVPVFRDVNKKGIIHLSHELAAISVKARDGKLTSADMQGGCFTISSLGGIGGTAFTPIVNAPEVAILGVSKSSMKPVWNGKEFTPRLMLPLALSYDHRAIDGAAGARFISKISAIMTDMRLLMM